MAACGYSTPPLQTAEPGVVFTYPIDAQVDVPLGARIVLTFSDPVAASAIGACSGQGTSVTGALCLVGPDGPVDATPEVSADGKSVSWLAPAMQAGTTYSVYARQELNPVATNLPASGPLFSFTTRTTRPRAALPSLVAVNGSDPTRLADPAAAFRPMFETSTIRLLFSEPLDPRSVVSGPGAVELVEMASGMAVPATVIASGIHVAIDPVTDLMGGATYQLRLGNRLVDLGGQSLAATSVTLVPKDTRGSVGPIPQVLRTRQPNDPGPATPRSGGERNVILIDKPLIGRETATLQPSTLAAELGDPKVLGGPIAFTIRKGQRLSASGLDIKLGGDIAVGLSTGDIQIELLTDGGGRIYRNPYQPADQRPENDRSPLFVDLSLDVAVYAIDPTGNAVLTQTVLGIQATGTAVGTEGVLAIESVASMELGLLGVTQAPSNLVLELITDPKATAASDTTAPTLVATLPPMGSTEIAVDGGVELIFDEPIDLVRARTGIKLETTGGVLVPSVLESHGSAVVVRPIAPLAYATTYRVVMSGVTDVAGNALTATNLSFATPALVSTGVPPAVLAMYPGAPCALTGGTSTSPGRCAGGETNDELYRPFTLPSNEAAHVSFTQPIRDTSIVLGTACGTGSVRVEELDAGGGACVAAVPGTVLKRERSLTFVPDRPWIDGKRYRLTLISGGDGGCGAGELCGIQNAGSFDPLQGTEGGDAGGPNLTINFTGAAASATTFMIAEASPFSDFNGSGFRDTSEPVRDENRAALRITGTTGSVSSASFNGVDCLPATTQKETCMYLQGAMPVALGELEQNCALPGGVTAPSCIPVTMSAQAMYATSVSMSASVGISIDADTGTSVMRVREPGGTPPIGYIIDRAGTPTLVAALDLYMDAPDMSLPLSSHDLHSKKMAVTLEGPVTFLPDGRIALTVANIADVPVEVNIDAPLGIGGSVKMIVPAGEMKLQLVSPALRGGAL